MRTQAIWLIVFVIGLSACSPLGPLPLPEPTPTEADPVVRATQEAVAAATTAQARMQIATAGAQTQSALDIDAAYAAAQQATAQAHLESLRASQTAIVASTWQAATEFARNLTETPLAATQSAAATESERQWIAAGWTATADTINASSTLQAGQAIGTATAASQQTSQALAVDTQLRQATLDAAAVASASTAVAAQAVEAEAAAQRTRITNEVLAWLRLWGPPLMLIIVVLLVFMGYLTWARNRVIARDARGAAPVLVLDGRVVNPDRMLYPAINPNQPDLPPVPAQLQIASQAQKADLVRALPPELASHSARRLVRQAYVGDSTSDSQAQTTNTVQVEIIDPDQAKPWLSEVRQKLLDSGEDER